MVKTVFIALLFICMLAMVEMKTYLVETAHDDKPKKGADYLETAVDPDDEVKVKKGKKGTAHDAKEKKDDNHKEGFDDEDDDDTVDIDNYSAETKKEILKSEEWWNQYYE